MLYAGLKGVPSYKQDSEVNKLLKRVQLFNVRDSLTHTTSTHSLTHPHTHSLIHSLTTSVRTLPQVANHRVRTYSGGMKRRLSVALAYIGDPQILFLRIEAGRVSTNQTQHLSIHYLFLSLSLYLSFPLAMIAIVSPSMSASSIECVVMIVTLPSFFSRMRFHMLRRIFTSIPVVGSSEGEERG